MLSELQKQKGIKLFNLLDDDRNGTITIEDYEDGAQRLAELRNYQPESSEYQILNSRYIKFWNSLQKVADTNKDDKITLDEWLEYFENLLKNKKQILVVMDYLFDLLDKDSDESITMEEYTLFLRGYRFDISSATEIFNKLDLNGDGHLSKEEFLQLANDFYFSDDPAAPGNWLLGLY